MAITNNDLFLALFRKLECAVKERKYASLLEYENSISENDDPIKRDRYKLVRTIRNYLVHRESISSFIEVSEDMLNWMESEIAMHNLHINPARSRVTSIPAKTLPIPVSTALEILLKYNASFIPILDSKKRSVSEISSVLSRECILKAALKGKDTVITKADIKTIKIVSETDLITDDSIRLANKPIIVFSNDNKYLGCIL